MSRRFVKERQVRRAGSTMFPCMRFPRSGKGISMRLLDRFRAGKLVAGIGVILAGTMTGCWEAPKRPSNLHGTNIPKTNVGMPGGAAGSSGGATGGTSANRTTGNPPLFDRDGRPTSGSSTGNSNMGPSAATGGNPNLLTPPGGGNGQQPIATNATKQPNGIQPANYAGSDPSGSPAPLKLPLTESSMPTGPAIEPVSTQNLDAKPKFRSSPPQIPVDSLQPAAPPAPNKPGTLLPPVTN